jgi:membrane protease YdiL (CAAX protease family)
VADPTGTPTLPSRGTQHARLALPWRLAIVFGWVTVASWAVFHAANGIWGTGYDRTSHVARAVAMLVLVVPAVLVACRYLDRATLSGIGLTALRRGWRPLLFGMACWLVPAAAGIATCAGFGWIEMTALAPPMEILWTVGQLLVLVLIFEALPEELVFRGYLQSNLATRWGPWPAIWAQAALFTGWGVVNGGDVTLERTALFLTFAVVMGRLRLITGTVWAPIGFHLAFQTVAQLFGAVGGAFQVTPSSVLAIVAFGALPFSVASIVRWPGQDAVGAVPSSGTQSGLVLRGVNYDTGTRYLPGSSSRPEWSDDAVRRDMRAIADDLHCTTVTVFGDEPDRLLGAATHALDAGLSVWLQPRTGEVDPERALELLRDVCVAAEALRQRHPGRVTVAVGCELSIFQPGIVPGRHYMARTAMITLTWGPLSTLWNRRLGAHLRRAATVARRHFHGDISYAAGLWEGVDWELFDLVGVNLYRDRSNHSAYRDEVRALHRYGKSVVITEFGCCTYEGADRKGTRGDAIVNWRIDPPSIKRNRVRDEQGQANYIAELLAVFAAERIHGAFVFEFSEPTYPHLPDPRHDLDMASYGIVKTHPFGVQRGSGDDAEWEPKAAFYRIAGIYGRGRLGTAPTARVP